MRVAKNRPALEIEALDTGFRAYDPFRSGHSSIMSAQNRERFIMPEKQMPLARRETLPWRHAGESQHPARKHPCA